MAFPVWYPLDAQSPQMMGDSVRRSPSVDLSIRFTERLSRDQRRGWRFRRDPDDGHLRRRGLPQIVCGWPDDHELFRITFPMDLQPQAHDIIRTRLFDSVLRAPGARLAAVDQCRDFGLGADPDREDVQVEGNVVTPLALLEGDG